MSGCGEASAVPVADRRKPANEGPGHPADPAGRQVRPGHLVPVHDGRETMGMERDGMEQDGMVVFAGMAR